jgi:hypothetical protein
MKEHLCTSEDLTCDRTAEIITTFQTHITTYIEKPNPVFGQMPICPFAQKARRDQKILYLVQAFQHAQDLRADSDLLDVIRKFSANHSYDILIVIHPDPQATSLEGMKRFMQDLNQLIHPLGLISLSGHPLDDFNVGGCSRGAILLSILLFRVRLS